MSGVVEDFAQHPRPLLPTTSSTRRDTLDQLLSPSIGMIGISGRGLHPTPPAVVLPHTTPPSHDTPGTAVVLDRYLRGLHVLLDGHALGAAWEE